MAITEAFFSSASDPAMILSQKKKSLHVLAITQAMS